MRSDRGSRNRPAGRAGRPRGFTLLEVVVALIIFALVFGALTQILATGFRQGASAERVVRATLVGEAMLARIGNEFALEPGRFGGDAGSGHRFEATVEPRGEPDQDLGIAAYRVDLLVFAEGDDPERGIHLTTIRLGPAIR